MFVTFKRLKLPSTMGDVERSILEVLSSGEAYQSNIVKATGFSRSRVSEVMSRLEKEGIIGRVAEGRNKRVYLKSNPVSRRPKGLIRLGLIRSAEYPFVIPFKKALRDMGFELEIEVFPNGIDVMKALSNGQLELGIAPMITQLYFFSAEFPIQILAPAGAGGSSVLALPSIADHPIAASTKLSTMELLLRTSVNGGVIGEPSEMIYARSAQEMLGMLRSGKVDAVSVWEPYASLLERDGYVRLSEYSDLGEHYCCTLASPLGIEESLLDGLLRRYRIALSEFKGDPERYIPPYAALMGFGVNELRDAIKHYTYPEELDVAVALRQVEQGGIRVPYPSLVREAIRH